MTTSTFPPLARSNLKDACVPFRSLPESWSWKPISNTGNTARSTEAEIDFSVYRLQRTAPQYSNAGHHRRFQKIKGFSLIEVLVSIVVLSFGLLGMVGLQAAALQANRDARLQSSASSFARELAEMMKGNKLVALSATGNPYLGDFSNPNGSTPLVPANPSYCLNVGGSACADPTEVAKAQMTEWLSRLDRELSGAHVTVCLDAAPFDSSGLPKPFSAGCTATTGANTLIKIGWTRLSTDRSQSGSAAFDLATRPSVIFAINPGNTL